MLNLHCDYILSRNTDVLDRKPFLTLMSSGVRVNDVLTDIRHAGAKTDRSTLPTSESLQVCIQKFVIYTSKSRCSGSQSLSNVPSYNKSDDRLKRNCVLALCSKECSRFFAVFTSLRCKWLHSSACF